MSGGKEGMEGHLKEETSEFNDMLEKETSKMTPNSPVLRVRS